jgi:hypothetical protein
MYRLMPKPQKPGGTVAAGVMAKCNSAPTRVWDAKQGAAKHGSTAKHGTGVSAKALTLVDREAWDQSKC